MKVVSIADVLSGKVPVGEEVEVRGWVRTRRDSKAGLSFIHLSDGSGFAPLQLVANGELTNYESEVKRLTTGCALTARGALVASQGKGQTVELVPREITVVGWVDDPETYPMQAKQHSMEYLREVGGRVDVRSAPEAGTTVTVRLPLVGLCAPALQEG
jgi:asparaginyl-tRNA synthetase